MKSKVVYIVVLAFFVSCSEQEQRPKEVLTEDQMVEVIAEVELTQALIKLKFSNPDTIVDRQELYNQVYNSFNITEEQFNASLTYYCQQPKVIEGIYVGVITRLSEEQVTPN